MSVQLSLLAAMSERERILSDFVAVTQRPTTRLEWAVKVGKARSQVTVYRMVA